MKKVYLCAPLGGDVTANLEKIRQYCRYALLCGTAPVVPHFYANALMTAYRRSVRSDAVPECLFYGSATSFGCSAIP